MGKFFLFLAANHAAILIYASLTEDEQKGCTERTVTGTEVANGYLLTPRQQHMNYFLWFLLQVHYKLWKCRIAWQNVENYSSGTLKQNYNSYPIQILYDIVANEVDTSIILIFLFSKYVSVSAFDCHKMSFQCRNKKLSLQLDPETAAVC